jgi:type II secretory ATPase GspE/PulE/Tfp pilus assembly ATPase PilB-like protein
MTPEERAQAETAAQEFAKQISLEYFDSRADLDVQSLSHVITLEGMKAYQVVPLELKGTQLVLGISEETRRDILDALKQRLADNGYQTVFKFISDIGWHELLNRYSIAENAELLSTADFTAISRRMDNVEPKFMLEPLVQLAYQLGSSDIHIEPSEKDARIRFRIDGTLHSIIRLSTERYELLTSDLQIRANVKWGSDVPQGGRVTVQIIDNNGDSRKLDMRLETVPSLHGQDVVIRLLNIDTKFLDLDNLQLYDDQRQAILKAVSHPQGLVLAVGPTGSGKTSLLYAIMNYLNNDQVKIVTLEDPVEYEIKGVSQVPVRSDQEQLFMEKLRAVLREDPNIIMIGEIRDADTAKTALQASLTGHLVLSTFHASSAAAAVTRMVDMVGQNPLLASSLRLIAAQRLVRLLCNFCKLEHQPTRDEALGIKAVFQDLPQEHQPDLSNIRLYRAVGCEHCHHFGYNGRIAIMELMVTTPKLQDLIGHATAATTTQAINQAAVSEGMITMLQDGLRKALEGKVSLQEVYKQIGD